MKRAAFGLLLAVVVASSTGCCLIDRLFHCNSACGGCGGGCSSHGCYDECYEGGPCSGGYGGGGGCLGCGHGGGGGSYADYGPPGPPTAQVTYPYYTTRGPRDYLAKNPRDIGP